MARYKRKDENSNERKVIDLNNLVIPEDVPPQFVNKLFNELYRKYTGFPCSSYERTASKMMVACDYLECSLYELTLKLPEMFKTYYEKGYSRCGFNFTPASFTQEWLIVNLIHGVPYNVLPYVTHRYSEEQQSYIDNYKSLCKRKFNMIDVPDMENILKYSELYCKEKGITLYELSSKLDIMFTNIVNAEMLNKRTKYPTSIFFRDISLVDYLTEDFKECSPEGRRKVGSVSKALSKDTIERMNKDGYMPNQYAEWVEYACRDGIIEEEF